MDLTYDEGRIRLQELCGLIAPSQGGRNEAMTRLQVIDRLFFECLGWSKDYDVQVEEPHDGQFADYVFTAPRRLLIVEAKREGVAFELPAGDHRLTQSLKTLLRDHPSLKPAIEQVQKYCSDRGVPFAAVANGHQIVAFVAVRTDAVPWIEGKALVFPTLQRMLDSFLDLWNAMSKHGVELQQLNSLLIGETVPTLPPKLSSTIPGYPQLFRRNVAQTDLSIVADLVLEDLVRAPELEDEFLKDCYIPSGTTSDYALLSKRILDARYVALYDPSTPGPTPTPAVTKKGVSPEILAGSLSRRPILLIGDVGVGKSIFIRHLVKVDARDHFAKRANAIYLDVGTKASLAPSLRAFIIREIESQLRAEHSVNVFDAHLIRGIYASDLTVFAKGTWGELRTANPALYAQKEVEFLVAKQSDTETHLKLALHFISKSQSRQIVLFMDNVDQQSEQIQQEAFLIAQELAENWPMVVYVTLRPETFNKSRHFGAVSGYAPKAFTIAPPRVDKVLEKRMEFALKLTSGEIAIGTLPEHTFVNLHKLEALIRVFLQSLSANPSLGECIENVSRGNIRIALELTKIFFSSGHVNSEKILHFYAERGEYVIPIHEFLRALILGDFAQYDPDASLFVNLFDVELNGPAEHFLMLCALGLLSMPANSDTGDGFVSVDGIYEGLQRLSFTPRQIDKVLIRLSAKGLIESAGRRIPQSDVPFPAAFRNTTLGEYHLARLCRHFAYADAIVVDTPIFDPSVRDQIVDSDDIGKRLDRGVAFWQYLSSAWECIAPLNPPVAFPSLLDELRRDITRIAERVGHQIQWGKAI